MTIFALTTPGLNAFKAINRHFIKPNQVNPQDKQLREFFEGKTNKAIVEGEIGFSNPNGGEDKFSFKVNTESGDTQDISFVSKDEKVDLDRIVIDHSTKKTMTFHEWFDLAASRHFVELARKLAIKFY